MYKNTILIFIFSPLFFLSQYSKKEIDSLMFKEFSRLRKEAQYENIISMSNMVIQNAKNINYLKGEAWGYARLGNAFCSLGKYKESLYNLNIAKKLSSSINDNKLKTSINIETGRNYNESGISVPQSIEKFKEAEIFANKIDDKYDKETYLLYIYQNLCSSYWNLEKKDLALLYAWKTKNIEEDAYILSFLAFYHIKETKNNDSIVYYLNKSTDFLNKRPTYIFEKTILYNQWGKYYEDRKQFEKAIENYIEAEKYGKESESVDEVLTALNGLSRSYEAIDNLEEAIIQERKHSRLQDSIIKAKHKNIDTTINNIIRNKEENFLESSSHIQKILAFIFIIIFIIIISFGLKIIKSRRQKRRIHELIKLKESIIYEKEEETQELKQKVNASFDEVIQLAKTNSSEFFTRFREVYPEVIIKLLEIEPKFRVSELTLCAYIYLGFSSKDIALYTFKSVNTVRSRKYKLRKKLNISPEENMELWIKNLG